MEDSWESGDPYEYFMGRWSRLVGQSFIECLSPAPGLKWLDIGCGTGVLSEVVLSKKNPSELIAIDQSEGFIHSARQRLGAQAQCKVGNALDLPLKDNSVDLALSGLVLNFISNPVKALQEMRRVTRPGGTIAIYIWDYSGKMEFLKYFWDAVVELDADASALHEGARFPDSNADGLKKLFKSAGMIKTAIEPIEVETNFKNFDDFWNPFLGGQGPAPTYVLSLDPSKRNILRELLQDRLPTQADGSIPLIARAWAARSEV